MFSFLLNWYFPVALLALFEQAELALKTQLNFIRVEFCL